MKAHAIIVAGGSSKRFDDPMPKQYHTVCGRPLLSWTISRFESANSIEQIVIVAAEEYLNFVGSQVVDPYGFHKVIKIVCGGPTRQDSVHLGLQALPDSTPYVAIHDGARPLVHPEDIDRTVKAAIQSMAAMLASPMTDTVKRVRNGRVIDTVEREMLYLAQTPQVFDYKLILTAHQKASESDSAKIATDDVSLIETSGDGVQVVEPMAPNPKVTRRDDLKVIEVLLAGEING